MIESEAGRRARRRGGPREQKREGVGVSPRRESTAVESSAVATSGRFGAGLVLAGADVGGDQRAGRCGARVARNSRAEPETRAQGRRLEGERPSQGGRGSAGKRHGPPAWSCAPPGTTLAGDVTGRSPSAEATILMMVPRRCDPRGLRGQSGALGSGGGRRRARFRTKARKRRVGCEAVGRTSACVTGFPDEGEEPETRQARADWRTESMVHANLAAQGRSASGRRSAPSS